MMQKLDIASYIQWAKYSTKQYQIVQYLATTNYLYILYIFSKKI